MFRNTKIGERYGLQFRTGFFNIFNRVQFGPPGNSFGSATFGLISSRYNSPRLVQLSLRLNYWRPAPYGIRTLAAESITVPRQIRQARK